MLKSKLKKIVGATALVGAILVSGSPAVNAVVKPEDLIPIRNKYKDAYQFQWNGNNKVTVFWRDSNGDSIHDTFDCVTVIEGTCYVYK